jgi:hypothetical protein
MSSPNVSVGPDMEPMALVGFAFKLPEEVVDEARLWQMLERRENVSKRWPSDRINVGSFLDQGVSCFSLLVDYLITNTKTLSSRFILKGATS